MNHSTSPPPLSSRYILLLLICCILINNSIIHFNGMLVVHSLNHNIEQQYLYDNLIDNKYNDIDSSTTGTSTPSTTSSAVTGSSSTTSSSPPQTPSPTPSSLYPFPNPNNYSIVTSTLAWGGGTILPICDVCNISGTYVSNYACGPNLNTPRGNWNNGVNYFDYPFPSVDVDVQEIAFVINGLFNCEADGPQASIVFLVQEVELFQPLTLNATDYCLCYNCVNTFAIQPFVSDANVTLNVTGSNKFRVFVEDNSICLSTIDIYFFYTQPSPPNGGVTKGLTTEQWIIIASSITGGLLLFILLFVFIKKRMARIGYTQLKDGKHIDINEIKIGERIGKGNFGEVFKGSWRGAVVAIKRLPMHNINETVLREFHREIELMKNLRHPNVIQYLGSCTIPPNICICTEYMPRGSLYSILHDASITLPWALIKNMCIDAAKGIVYLHNSNPVIFHRDLKSHNLLVDESWKVKVADFGLSTIEQSNTMTSCGTPWYTCPEILRNQRYTEKADVYSFAIVMWECATRQDPYNGMPPFQVIFAVGREGLRPPVPRASPPDFVQLILDCWSENPASRPSMEQVLQRLEAIDISGWPDLLVKPTHINHASS